MISSPYADVLLGQLDDGDWAAHCVVCRRTMTARTPDGALVALILRVCFIRDMPRPLAHAPGHPRPHMTAYGDGTLN